MVDLGMAFVDNWVVGKEKGCYWLSNDIVGLVGNSYAKTQTYIQYGIMSVKNQVGRLRVHDKTNHTLASQVTLTR